MFPKNTKILVVDDMKGIRVLITKLLKELGYATVQEAENGEMALEIITKAQTTEPFGLVICDLRMPKMDGLDLLSKLRTDQAFAKLPFVMLTAESEKENVMQALLEVNKIEVPKALIQLEIGRLQQQTANDLAARGIDPGQMQLPTQLFEQQAERRVALGLILGEIVKANDLTAKPEQVRVVVDEFAESYEDPQEVVSWYYASPRPPWPGLWPTAPRFLR
jgi:CheY-like chemotaxis protein